MFLYPSLYQVYFFAMPALKASTVISYMYSRILPMSFGKQIEIYLPENLTAIPTEVIILGIALSAILHEEVIQKTINTTEIPKVITIVRVIAATLAGLLIRTVMRETGSAQFLPDMDTKIKMNHHVISISTQTLDQDPELQI